MNTIDIRKSARWWLRAFWLSILVLTAGALMLPDAADARGGRGGGMRAGGGGGGRMAQPSVSSANRAASANRSAADSNRAAQADRSAAADRSADTGSNRSRDVERSTSRERDVNRETDIEIDSDYDIDDGFDHPWAAAATIGAMAATTAAAIGSMYYALPPDCTVVIDSGVQYHHCGSVYYEERYEGDQVVYVAVEP